MAHDQAERAVRLALSGAAKDTEKIARTAGVSLGTATAMLLRLEGRGLVVRGRQSAYGMTWKRSS